MQTYQQVEQKELEPWQTDYQKYPELEHLILCMWADQLFLQLLIIMTKVTHTSGIWECGGGGGVREGFRNSPTLPQQKKKDHEAEGLK